VIEEIDACRAAGAGDEERAEDRIGGARRPVGALDGNRVPRGAHALGDAQIVAATDHERLAPRRCRERQQALEEQDEGNQSQCPGPGKRPPRDGSGIRTDWGSRHGGSPEDGMSPNKKGMRNPPAKPAKKTPGPEKISSG